MDIQTIEYYQELDFFLDYSPEAVLSLFNDSHPIHRLNCPWDEIYLLAKDQQNAWSGDFEIDVCDFNKVYEEVIVEWAQITKGVFNPVNIKEQWDSNKGPIQISFKLNQENCLMKPEFQNDWLDLLILNQINETITNSDSRFDCVADGNFCLILFLNPEKHDKLRNERGFPFAL